MLKPKIWQRKGRLTKNAKLYLRFKLTQYWEEKKRKEKEKQEDFPIRVSAKIRYDESNKPIIVEAFIDGMYSERHKLRKILQDAIEKSFDSDKKHGANKLVDEMEYGDDKRIPFSRGNMEIRYKSSISAKWNYMR